MTILTEAPSSHTRDAISPEVMRAAMGAFCSGVVVVTARGEGTNDEPLGFTCQSFVSLSLDPPLVMISPSRTSSTWPRIKEVGRFAINVLAHDHADLSGKFARSGSDKYAGVSWRTSPQGSPILDGVAAWVECELWREYDGGDHTIAIGRVTGVGHDIERNPLLYYRGSYPSAQWQAS